MKEKKDRVMTHYNANPVPLLKVTARWWKVTYIQHRYWKVWRAGQTARPGRRDVKRYREPLARSEATLVRRCRVSSRKAFKQKAATKPPPVRNTSWICAVLVPDSQGNSCEILGERRFIAGMSLTTSAWSREKEETPLCFPDESGYGKWRNGSILIDSRDWYGRQYCSEGRSLFSFVANWKNDYLWGAQYR